MDIHDLNHRYGISIKKLRLMERAGVLRVGKSQLPPYWQMVRSDLRQGKMSARSVALAYLYPDELEKIGELSGGHRRVIAAHFLEADLPQAKPLPIEFDGRIATIVCGAATDGGSWLERFISILKSQIAEKPVGYLYVAVRILLMCEDQWSVKNTAEFLPRAFAKARDDPAMNGWWHKRALEKPKKFSIIFHRPQEPFDL